MFKELPELKRRRKATIYIQLTHLTHFVSVTTTTDDWADDYSSVEQGRFELDDTLREAWEVFGMNYPVALHDPQCWEREHQSSGNSPTWRAITDRITMGDLMEGFQQRLIKVTFRWVVMKRR